MWEHASTLIRILKLSVHKKCESINPLMEPWEASIAGTPAGIVMDSRFLSYGKEKESRSRSGSTTPFGYVRGTLRWKKKFLFTHGWGNAGSPAIKRCGFSTRVNATITDFFLSLYHQADYPQVKNLSGISESNLWQTRMGKAMMPPGMRIAIWPDMEIRR